MAKNSPRLRVLVVEDEGLIRWSIAETLSNAGHTVIEADSGAAAIQELSNGHGPIDAVVLDYRLPDSDDLRLLANVRRLAPASPVILMTAVSGPEVARGALDLGAYTVMNKPFEMQDLEALLVQACADQGVR